MGPKESRFSIGIVEFNLGGHRESYLCELIDYAIELEYEISVWCPDPSVIARRFGDRVFAGEVELLGLGARAQPGGSSWEAVFSGSEGAPPTGVHYLFFPSLTTGIMRSLDEQCRSHPGRQVRATGILLGSHSYLQPVTPNHEVRHLESDCLRSLCVFEEDAVADLETAMGKAVFHFPEIIVESDGAEIDEGEVRRWEEQMDPELPLILSIGAQRPKKAPDDLARLCIDGAGSFQAAIVGKIPWDAFEAEERRWLEEFKGERHGILVDEFVSDEAFHWWLNRADVVFCGYRDFPHSSNVLALAISLHKPVVVRAGGVMAAQVSKMGCGVVVGGDYPELRERVEWLTGHLDRWEEILAPRWPAPEALRRAPREAFVKAVETLRS